MKAPTWQELREAGRVLIDQPEQGLAIYPSTHGVVVIGVRGQEGGVHLTSIQLGEMDAVAHALAECEARAAVAKEMLHEQESMFEAFHLIQRVKGAA